MSAALFLIFVAGPLFLWFLIRRGTSRGYIVTLWMLLVALLLAALALRNGWIAVEAREESLRLSVVLFMWMAWILMLALVGIALRRSGLSAGAKRTGTALALVATTLPWIGLFIAQVMTS